MTNKYVIQHIIYDFHHISSCFLTDVPRVIIIFFVELKDLKLMLQIKQL